MAANNILSAFILLDRSGSMSGARWENAIASINKYVDTLKADKINAEITLAAFDHTDMHQAWPGGLQMQPRHVNLISQDYGLSFTVLRDKVNIKKFKTLSANETAPRGATPLYDATARLINMADNKNNDKTVIIIMTDGEENSSRTYNLSSIRDRIAACQNRGWEVVFLGAEFNADHIATSYGLSRDKVINSSLGNMERSMSFMAASSTAYAMTGEAINTAAVKSAMEKTV